MNDRQRRCQGKRKDGHACRSFALPDSPYCISHDPDQRERQLQGQRAGGKSRSNDARAIRAWQRIGSRMTLAEAQSVLHGAGLAVLDGTLEPARLQAFATAIRTSLAIAEQAMFDHRLRELESTMRKIEGVQDEQPDTTATAGSMAGSAAIDRGGPVNPPDTGGDHGQHRGDR